MYESQQPSHTNLSFSEFSLTAEQYQYIEKMLPRYYSLVDVKKKKDKKDPILGDI